MWPITPPINLIAAVLFITAMLTGCAGIQKPETVRESVAYAAASWNAANLSAGDLCQREVLTEEACEKLADTSAQVFTALQAAQAALKAGNDSAAQSHLALASKALLVLQQMVASAGKGI